MARVSFVDVALRLRGAKRFNAEVAAASKQLEGMGVKGAAAMGGFAQKAGRLKSAGRSLTLGVTLPIVAAGAAAVAMSMDYESAFGKIQRLVGVSTAQLETWKDETLEVSNVTGVPAKELADALFFIASAGLRGRDAIDALEASAKAAAAGLGETKVVADAVTSAVNNYGQGVLTAADATDVLLKTVAAGKVEPDQLAGVLGQVVPIAQSAGVSFEEVGAGMATLTRLGQPASRAATALAAVLMTFAKPTTQMTDALGQVGFSLDQVRERIREKGLISTIELLRERAKRAGVDLSAIFANRRALQGADTLTKNMKVTNDVMKMLGLSSGATDKAFRQLEERRGFQMDRALERMKNTLIDLGRELGPVVLPKIADGLEAIAKAAKDVMKWFRGQDKEVKIIIAALIGLVAVMGPVIFILGTIATAIGAIMIFAASPIALIVLGVLALIAAIIFLAIKFKWFRDALFWYWKAIFNYLKFVFNAIKTALILAFKAITAYIKFMLPIWKGIAKGLAAAFVWAKNAIVNAWNWIKTAATNTKNWVVKAFNDVINFFKGLPGKISSAVSGAFDGIKDAFRSAINFIIDAWNGLDLSLSILGKTVSIGTPNIPRLADGGTVTQPGMAMVGERGPELLSLPRGASVIPLSQSVANNAGGPQRIEVPVYLNGRQIALAVADEVSNAKARA